MISIISAYYNKEDMTLDFLDNLSKVTPKVEVLITNAGSKPIEHPFMTKRTDLKVNKSFSNSMNAVLKEAKGDFVVLMGNDVFPTVGWLDDLISLAEKTGAWITCPINTQTNLNSYRKSKENDEYFETDMFPAVCWVLSRKCIDTVGAFDEQFEVGCYEDNDYCKRVLMAGGKIVVSKKVNVGHLVSQTLGQFDVQKTMQSNFEKYVSKWS